MNALIASERISKIIINRALILCTIIFNVSFSIQAQEKNILSNRIIPQPASFKVYNENFSINSLTVIKYTNPEDIKTAEFLKAFISTYFGEELKTEMGKATANSIHLKSNSEKIKEKEGYTLKVSKRSIEITGHDHAGVFYGAQSLVQLIQQEKSSKLQVSGCFIQDAPRFGYRGMHLDVSRHMFSTAFIKKYIDLLAFYKFNTFHWHLTDDQGWRIEIKNYPNLQTFASYRKETIIGHKKETPHVFDGKRYGGYYSQDEIREIVKYAQERHINIIPEIEMPGHASAVLAAYPELGCTGGPYRTATFWGIFDEVFCAGSETVFKFLQDVIDEVTELFPSSYIHVGGDECTKGRWKACPKCQYRIKEEGLKDEFELQSYFIRRIEKYLHTKGRKLIGWDEILEGGLSPGATVMSWRGEDGGIEAARHKNKVIMTPDNYVYFDYYQSLHPDEPIAAASYTSLAKVYHYEPIPEVLNIEEAQYILGVQGAVWTEYMPEPSQVEYMVFPRAIALAEVAWTPVNRKDFHNFHERLNFHELLLDKFGVNNFKNYEITQIIRTSPQSNISVELTSSRPGMDIRYTLDGSEPSSESTLYQQPVLIHKSTTLKARLFEGNTAKGRIFQQELKVHKATGKHVELKNLPSGTFNGSASTLVNGIFGTHRYNDKQWLGFSGEDFEAVVDLDSVHTITQVGINVLNYHWQRIWEPTELIFYTSEDGKTYKEVFRENRFPVNGINHINASIEPVKAQFIKIFAKNKGIIPVGEYMPGTKAWLLIDEIIVD